MPAAPRDVGPLALRNQRVRRLRKLLDRRSDRDAERRFVLEGAKLLEEALAARVPVEAVFATAGTAVPAVEEARRSGIDVAGLAPGVAEKIADTVTPQPVFAIVPYVDVPLDRLVTQSGLLVVAVDVRDPGNAGTLMRSAEASGAAGVVFCEGSVDVYNPKTVRASAGAVFHVPLVAGGDPVDVLDRLAAADFDRMATVAAGGDVYTSVDLSGRIAIVLGNEAHGLPPAVSSHVDGAVTIPMDGRAESLNVGMAATVLCFEAARQRAAAAAGISR